MRGLFLCMKIAGAVLVAQLFAPASLIAAPLPSDDMIRCRDRTDLDPQIKGCTAVIESGDETQANRAVAFKNLGDAYYMKRDFDRAIANFDQAVELNPDFAMAFHDRGGAYMAKADFDRAIVDGQFASWDDFEPHCRRVSLRGSDAADAGLALLLPRNYPVDALA